jgi:alpha-galactosidase
MKLVLIGAGSAQFGLGTLGDFFQCERLYGAEIVLVDIKADALAEVQRKADEFLAQHPLPFTVRSTTDRKEALSDADFVIISIEVGKRFALWDEDWTLPQQYGIRQIYGENGGVGGLFHALRITPVILEICDDVATYCPDAWVFNYSNPMTAITTAVLRRYPQMKFVGLCHEVLSLERYLPVILETPFSNLKLRSAGLNHFSVLLEATYRDSGSDAYPDILAKAPSFFEQEPGYSDILSYVQRTGTIPKTEGAVDRIKLDVNRSAKSWADRTLFREILDTYHLLPITVDSHLGEYIQWAHEVADHRGIKDFYTLYQMELSQLQPRIELRRDERLVLIIQGILDDQGYEEPAVNVMNDGLIPDLPASIAVEVPAKVHRSGLKPISFSTYPKGFGALLRAYSGVYDLTVEAILTGKKEYVLQALLANPTVGTYRELRELVDLMIERQQPYLGYLQ